MFASVSKTKFNLPVDYENLSPTEKYLVREEYRRKQKDLCWYCQEALTSKPAKKVRDMKLIKSLFPKGFFNYPIHLHHDHDTDLTIGAVHNRCNAYLWQVEGQ